jgi:hypothetical protein
MDSLTETDLDQHAKFIILVPPRNQLSVVAYMQLNRGNVTRNVISNLTETCWYSLKYSKELQICTILKLLIIGPHFLFKSEI